MEKKKNKLWKKAKKGEHEEKMLKWSILARQINDVITRMLHFQTHYGVDSNAFMIEEMALPLELSIP